MLLLPPTAEKEARRHGSETGPLLCWLELGAGDHACYVVEGHPLAAVARCDSLTDGAGETASSSSSSPTPSPQSPVLIEHEINAIV